ncbi:MAG: hypothetical protein H6Q66_491 [Firmicutes bacterium]|nr:hypothetical protein [Bacillota bacterium]
MSKEEILLIADKVNSILDDFLVLEEKIFGNPSFLKTLKNLFKKKVGFKECYEQLQVMTSDLDSSLEAIRGFVASDEQERGFKQILETYTIALKEAGAKATVVAKILSVKADGGSISWSSYKELIDDYKKAEQQYVTLGQELTRQYQALYQIYLQTENQ